MKIDRNDFQLTFIPEFITIKVSKESEVYLCEDGRLELDPGAAGTERTIDVPVTILNAIALVARCLKKGHPAELAESWEQILTRHGNTRVKSHWFYPKKEGIGFGKSYMKQKEIAAEAGLEINSLVDMTLYYLLGQITSDNHKPDFTLRTSTLTGIELGLDHIDFPTPLSWDYGGPRLRFSNRIFDEQCLGAAVGVPTVPLPPRQEEYMSYLNLD